jgi:hypothetical protein
MRETWSPALLLAAALATHAGSLARADSPPPPFLAERPFFEMIEKAGFPCGQAVSHVPASGADADAIVKQGLEAFIVQCLGDKTYLVGRPRLGLDGHPLSVAASVVKEITVAHKNSG